MFTWQNTGHDAVLTWQHTGHDTVFTWQHTGHDSVPLTKHTSWHSVHLTTDRSWHTVHLITHRLWHNVHLTTQRSQYSVHITAYTVTRCSSDNSMFTSRKPYHDTKQVVTVLTSQHTGHSTLFAWQLNTQRSPRWGLEHSLCIVLTIPFNTHRHMCTHAHAHVQRQKHKRKKEKKACLWSAYQTFVFRTNGANCASVSPGNSPEQSVHAVSSPDCPSSPAWRGPSCHSDPCHLGDELHQVSVKLWKPWTIPKKYSGGDVT